MNNYKFLAVVGNALVLGTVGIHAQTPCPPEEPFLNPVSENAHWVVQVQGLPDQPKNQASQNTPDTPSAPETPATAMHVQGGRYLRQIDVTRSNSLLRKINTWADGTQTVKWWQGSYLMLKEPEYETVFVVPWESLILNEDTHEQFSNTSFPELRWVTASTFLEWATIGDRRVAVYGQKQTDLDKLRLGVESGLFKVIAERMGIESGSTRSVTPNPTSRVGFARLAWIDGQTKRPIAMESARSRWTYTFSDDQIAPIELPPGFRNAIGRYLDAANVQKLDVKP